MTGKDWTCARSGCMSRAWTRDPVGLPTGWRDIGHGEVSCPEHNVLAVESVTPRALEVARAALATWELPYDDGALERLVADVIDAETERCARVAEEHDCEQPDETCHNAIAAAIRATRGRGSDAAV